MNEKNKRIRLDEYLVFKKMVASRHQAADLIRRRLVKINGRHADKPATRLDPNQRWRIQLQLKQSYVSRAGYKLEAAAETFQLDFKGKTVFDVGAHKGGFSDYALRAGAKRVVAIDVGRQALDPALLSRPEILAFTRTDVRDFVWPDALALPDFIIVDLSFISLTKALGHLTKFCQANTWVLALAKPQFEAEGFELRAGVIKNQAQRREILKRLEAWFKDNRWAVLKKADSALAGLKGNLERFYLLQPPSARPSRRLKR